jgi:hypothetical protein
MKDTKKLFVYLGSFYVYGCIVAFLGLQEVFSGNTGLLPMLLVTAGVGIALAPGCKLQTAGSPRKHLPSDGLAIIMGTAAVSITVVASTVVTIG